MLVFLQIMKFLVFSLLLLAFFFTACKKESFITSPDARISISADTLHFDTVFTSTGSVTKAFKIINENNQQLRLNSITLKGGIGSAFKINADGTPGPSLNNIEIGANDSIYIFVNVSINPNTGNLPFVVQDSIEIVYNGNNRLVQLEAWGQNANFLRNQKIVGNIIWNSPLPYVILGGLQIDTTATLTIEKGTRIYLHADAPILVDGSLKVNGQKHDSSRVYFQGDRLDEPYKNFPGGWPGIYFRGRSKDNVLQYAVIKNAYQALVAEQASINANPKLTIKQCIIDNTYGAAIYGVRTSITAENCLISNAAAEKNQGSNLFLVYGGTYNFSHCTVVSYSNAYIPHVNPVVTIANYVQPQPGSFLTADLNASFTNCIFWGENGPVDDEVVTYKQGTGAFNISFTNCLWKVKTNPANSNIVATLNNQPPLFDSVDVAKRFYNFRLKDSSPAINKGIATGLLTDLDGNNRASGLPDMGCYEKQ